MTDPRKAIVDFVEGRLEPEEFEKLLYADVALEAVLRAAPVPRYARERTTSVYTYLLELNFADPASQLDAQGIAKSVLEAWDLAFDPSPRYEKVLDVLHSAQPPWVEVPSVYLSEVLLPLSGGRKDDELQEWLSSEIKRHFRYASSPPSWIQSPAWPIRGSTPLVFLGQVSVRNYFHDEAAVYVFHDPETGTCETVVQVY